jgi:hypothetical protein
MSVILNAVKDQVERRHLYPKLYCSKVILHFVQDDTHRGADSNRVAYIVISLVMQSSTTHHDLRKVSYLN